MANQRENITNRVYELLKAQRTVKLGKVERDPINLNDLPKTAFPAVYIESTDEEIERVAQLGTGVNYFRSELEVHIVLSVGGRERDKQRNTAIAAIESTLLSDQDLQGIVDDIRLSRVESIVTGESAPFASCRIVVLVDYCYSV